MAHVGISKALVDEVKQSIGAMAQSERDMKLKALHQDVPQVYDSIAYTELSDEEVEDIRFLVWDDNVHLYDVVPEEWCVKREEFPLSWIEPIVSSQTGEIGNAQLRFTIRAVGDRFRFPPKSSNYSDHRIAARPKVAERYVQYINVRNKVTYEVKSKYSLIANQVTTYLQSCKSLNAAVKALPDIKLYIPQAYLDRMEVKVERAASGAKAEEHAAAIDTSLLVSTAVMHKFIGAQE